MIEYDMVKMRESTEEMKDIKINANDIYKVDRSTSMTFKEKKKEMIIKMNQAIEDNDDNSTDQNYILFEDGDGTIFRIIAQSYTLQQFKKNYTKLQATPKKPKKIATKNTMPKPTGNKRENWNVEKIRVIEDYPDWVTDSVIMIKSSLPKKYIGYLNNENKVAWINFERLFKNTESLIDAEIKYYKINDNTIQGISKIPIALSSTYPVLVIFKAKNKFFCFDSEKLNIINNRYSDIKFKIDTKNRVLYAYNEESENIAMIKNMRVSDDIDFDKDIACLF